MFANTNPRLSSTGGTISVRDARLLIQTYKEECGWGSEKTRSVWFSVDNFKQIEELAARNVDGKQCNGARIYFGRYPSTDLDLEPPLTEYLGRDTLVFVPTYDEIVDGMVKHRDLFNVLAPVDGKLLGGDDDQDAYNHGELCPPNTGC